MNYKLSWRYPEKCSSVINQNTCVGFLWAQGGRFRRVCSKVGILTHQGCIFNLITRFDNIRLELVDVNECFELVTKLVMDTPAEPYFLSVLQHLVCIRYLLFILLRPEWLTTLKIVLQGRLQHSPCLLQACWRVCVTDCPAQVWMDVISWLQVGKGFQRSW